MANRYTETSKWDLVFFHTLSNEHKLFWLYLNDKCDHAGIWSVNWSLVKGALGLSPIDPIVFGDRIKVLSEEKWFLCYFIQEQQKIPNIKDLNPSNKCHASILNILYRENIIDPLGAKSPYKGSSNVMYCNVTTQPNTSNKDTYSYKNTIKKAEQEFKQPSQEERAHNEAVWAAENYNTEAWRKTLGEEVANFLKIGLTKQKVKDMFLHRRVPEALIDELMKKEF